MINLDATTEEILRSMRPRSVKRQYEGYSVYCGFPLVITKMQEPQLRVTAYLDRRRDGLREWLDTNCIGKAGFDYALTQVDFEREDDALLFYLTFAR